MTAPRFRFARTFADSVLPPRSGGDARGSNMTPHELFPLEHGAALRDGAD